MDYEFNNEYLTKSLISLVRDEGNRVVRAELAADCDVKSLVQPALDTIVDSISDGGLDAVIKSLSFLHSRLSLVRLPGDFEKVAEGIIKRFGIKDREEKEVAEDDTIDDHEVCAEMEREYGLLKSAVLDKLSNLVYDLGISGNHNSAYLIERKIHEIRSIKNL